MANKRIPKVVKPVDEPTKPVHPLERFRDKYNMWKNDQVLALSNQDVQDIVDIIRTRHPGYGVMAWCNYCVGKMFELAFEIFKDEL